MATGFPSSDAILKMVVTELEKAADAEIEHATEEIKRKLRQKVGRIAIDLARYYSVERVGTDVLIKVSINAD